MQKALNLKTVFTVCMIPVTVLIIVFNRSLQTNKYVALLTLAISVSSVLRARHNWKLFIVYGFIAYANYSIYIANFPLLLPPIDTYYTRWSSDAVSIAAVNILFLFTVMLALFFKDDPACRRVDFFKDTPNDSAVVAGMCLLLIFIYFYGFAKPETAGERGTPSTIYEYSVVLFIIAFHYSKNRTERIILTVIMAMFALQNIIYGGRVTALQLLICWYLLFLADRIKLLRALPVIFTLLILLTAVGTQRTTMELNAQTFSDAVDYLTKCRLANDTAYAAFYTSLTFLKTAAGMTVGARLKLFGSFLVSMIAGGSFVPNANLAEYTLALYWHSYGGVLPFFGMFYLGWAGVAALGGYLSVLLRKLLTPKGGSGRGLTKCLAVYFICTVPRWYLYSPSPIIRGLLLLTVVYAAAWQFHSMSAGKRREKA